MRILYLILLLAFLSACNGLPKRESPPAEVMDMSIDKQINPDNQQAPIIETSPLMNNAVRSLYNQAQSHYLNSYFNKALTSLERAHKIQPNAPQVSQLLAEISLHQGNNEQAHYWAIIATKNGPSKGQDCEKSWRILAIAAEKLSYYSQQAEALEKKESCLVKLPNRF